jgi:hypothetical protein
MVDWLFDGWLDQDDFDELERLLGEARGELDRIAPLAREESAT